MNENVKTQIECELISLKILVNYLEHVYRVFQSNLTDEDKYYLMQIFIANCAICDRLADEAVALNHLRDMLNKA